MVEHIEFVLFRLRAFEHAYIARRQQKAAIRTQSIEGIGRLRLPHVVEHHEHLLVCGQLAELPARLLNVVDTGLFAGELFGEFGGLGQYRDLLPKRKPIDPVDEVITHDRIMRECRRQHSLADTAHAAQSDRLARAHDAHFQIAAQQLCTCGVDIRGPGLITFWQGRKIIVLVPTPLGCTR